MTDVEKLAARLDRAQREAQAVPQLDEELSPDDAYRVQRALLERRYARGERRFGVKMGFTSRAKMAQMGVSEMIWGRLTDAMLVEDGGELDFLRYIHPRAEPEIAFILGKQIDGPVTLASALASVEAVAPALEVIDSRYENFRFSVTDVIADNSSSSAFVVGPWAPPSTDVANLGMLFGINGAIRQIGSSAAILGHPLRSLVAAARLACAAGEPLKAGDVVMAGGATASESLAPGDSVRLEVQSLGTVEFRVVPKVNNSRAVAQKT
jgi:2-oxo-3-hexenedioate decarboxylase